MYWLVGNMGTMLGTTLVGHGNQVFMVTETVSEEPRPLFLGSIFSYKNLLVLMFTPSVFP